MAPHTVREDGRSEYATGYPGYAEPAPYNANNSATGLLSPLSRFPPRSSPSTLSRHSVKLNGPRGSVTSAASADIKRSLDQVREMAIAYSAPVYERRSRRSRRESTAVSTNIKTQVEFGDLSLSSQLLYAAMVETWRVVQEIAGEESVVIFEKEKEDEFEEQGVTDMEDARISTGFLAEEFLTELDNMEEESLDMEQTNSDIIGGFEISTFADENNNNEDDDVGQSVPDLIAGGVWGETKLSGFVPDLVACCLPAGATNDQSHTQNTSLSQKTGVRQNIHPRQNRKLKENTHKKQTSPQKHNHSLADQHHTSTTDTTDSTQRGERSRVLDLQRHKDTHHHQERLSKKSLEEKSESQGEEKSRKKQGEEKSRKQREEKSRKEEEETKSSWAETGRQLSRIAQAEEKRRRIESGRPSSPQSSHFDGRSNFSALLQEEDLDPLIEKYSDVLSAIAIAGISYLVRRMFN